jgi:hypothetical protein
LDTAPKVTLYLLQHVTPFLRSTALNKHEQFILLSSSLKNMTPIIFSQFINKGINHET